MKPIAVPAIFLLATVIACSSSAPSASAAMPIDPATQPAAVNDPVYQINAATIQIPAGWRFAGAVVRPQDCHSGGTNLKFTAQSPDGLSAISQLPGVAWNWTSSKSMERIMYQMNCPPIALQSAGNFLVNIAVPAMHEKATIVAVLPFDAPSQALLAKEQAEKNQALQQMAASYGQQAGKVVIEGARVRVQFQLNSHAIDEEIYTSITCTDSITPGTMMEAASRSRSCTTNSIMVARAPQGQLDALVNSVPFLNLGKNARVNPEWQNRVAQNQQAAFQKQQAASNAAFRAVMANGDAARRKRMADSQAYLANEKAGYAQHNAAEANRRAVVSEGSHQVSLYAADRADFINPATGQKIEADGGYNHQWMSSDGNHLYRTTARRTTRTAGLT
jgi:hypothetical protein